MLDGMKSNKGCWVLMQLADTNTNDAYRSMRQPMGRPGGLQRAHLVDDFGY